MNVSSTPNIGPRGQRRRLRFGLIAFGAAIVVAAVLVIGNAAPAWRFAVFPFLWLAGLGYFQARERT